MVLCVWEYLSANVEFIWVCVVNEVVVVVVVLLNAVFDVAYGKLCRLGIVVIVFCWWLYLRYLVISVGLVW